MYLGIYLLFFTVFYTISITSDSSNQYYYLYLNK